MSYLFDDDGNLSAYLQLTVETQETIEEAEKEPKANKVSRIISTAFRMFLNKLGSENFEKFVSGNLTVKDCLEIAQIPLTRKKWAKILGKEFGYAEWNKDGLSDLFNNQLNKYFHQIKGRKPYVIVLTEYAVNEFLNQALGMIESENTEEPEG